MKVILKGKAEVREWALRQGFEVASTGDLPRYAVSGYSEWLAAATLEERAQLTQWTEERKVAQQQSQLELARGMCKWPTHEMTLEEIVQKIEVFERQNPDLRVSMVVRRRSETGK
jgi:crotonobetainyl-CoA:carnitine CoA-transferase CaiB-like acyl-CoA transferase